MTVHEGVGSTFEAEALACNEIVRMGLAKQVQRVIFEGNCSTVIKKCSSNDLDKYVLCAHIT